MTAITFIDKITINSSLENLNFPDELESRTEPLKHCLDNCL